MLYYEKCVCSEDAEWIVLLHGYGATHFAMRWQSHVFSAAYNTLSIDLPGHGGSKDMPSPFSHTPEELNAQISAVLDENGIQSAHFVGICLGSLVILGYAAACPNRVLSIVAGGSLLGLGGFYRVLIRLGVGLSKESSYLRIYRLAASILMPGKKNRRSRELYLSSVHRLGSAEFCAWLRYMIHAVRTGQYIDRLNKTKGVPVLFLSGERDFLLVSGTKKHSASIFNSTLQIISGCGHLCNIEKADEFNRLSLDFIDAHGTCEQGFREECY